MSSVALPGLNDANPVRQNTAIRQLSEQLANYALTTYVDAADAAEVVARDAAIAVEAADRAAADAAEVTARDAAIAVETADRTAADALISADVATKEPAITGGTTSQFWRGDKTWQAIPLILVARYYDAYTANADLTTAIPYDDTIPTSTEGTQIISRSVTTTTSTQRVRLTFTGNGSCSTSNNVIAAAFSGTTCIRTASGYFSFADAPAPISLQVEDAPGAAGTYTYSIRVGAPSGTVRMNGSSTARFLGGSYGAVLVTEVIEP